MTETDKTLTAQPRTEKDSLGEVLIPAGALYGIQSFRAKNNFPDLGQTVNFNLIKAIIQIKKAAAVTLAELVPDKAQVFRAVAAGADEILAGQWREMFIVPAIQGGAGTSTNMNCNEVLANLALDRLGLPLGSYATCHPLDDVNRGQSTNDVYPTALRIAAIALLRDLSQAAANLQEALQEKENEFAKVFKLGRTELMDAVPVTLGEEFGAYAQALARDRWRLYKMEERLREINLGGEAVGLTDRSNKLFRFGVVEKLRQYTGMGLAAAEYPMDITQNNDVFVEVSGLLRAMAVNLKKISGDLRLMNSGPYGGLGEIRLAPQQMGSTIMPGKVNPVIPEMVICAAFKVMANDLALTMAAGEGEFELNAFVPVIAESLLESFELLIKATNLFRVKAIQTVTAAPERCQELLAGSLAKAAGFAPILGYDRVSQIIANHPQNPAEALSELDAAIKAQEPQP
ncbi:MAG: aspartate ammonia-lyase [Deltaproteobacteria bacterium]|jgi:aspartate ammonia-lyase|nr:aspartate ammonia-lyase [Deltaproteobacteria bacterium]